MPDFYQGTDLWDLSLVDPDNRRPVDFELRQSLLDDVDRILALPHDERVGELAGLLQHWEDGRLKLLATTVGLRLRQRHPELFLSGSYLPLTTEISVSSDVVAFARLHDSAAAIIVGPRLCAPLVDSSLQPPLGGERWKTSRILLPPALADRTFRHEITGAQIKPTATSDQAWLFVGEAFQHVPIAILTAE